MKQEFRIEKGVPYPETVRYKFKAMMVGDSFWANDERGLRNSADNAGRRLKRKFSVRKIKEDGVWGFRCWRVE